MHNLDPWALIAFLLLMVPAVAQMSREWDGAPMFSWKHLWAARWAACLLLGGGLFFGHQWFETIGFRDEFPDAINCRSRLPGDSNQSDFANITFYQSKIMNGRTGVGQVVVFFHAGGFNSKKLVTRRDPSSWARTSDNDYEMGYAPE